MSKFIQKNWLLLAILLLGIFLRLYKFDEFFLYGHDHDLAGWVMRDIIENKHLRLIGQETSNPGVFIGPLWYYLLIPFYALTGMDPIGGILLATLIGISAIGSMYWVVKKVFDEKIAIIAAIVYAVSNYTVFTDREVVPTTPAMLWTIWFLYAIHLVYKGKQKSGFLLAAVLLGLVWHINLAIGLLSPLLVVAWFLSHKKIQWKYALISVGVLLVMLLPFLAFEARHGFSQTQAIIAAVTTSKNHIDGTSQGVLQKLDRVFQLVYKNTAAIFYGNLRLPTKLALVSLLGSFAMLFYKKKIKESYVVILGIWLALFVIFFTLNSINLSEYYINGMNIVWILIFSLGISSLLNSKRWQKIALVILVLFISANIWKVIRTYPNQSGYLYRKAIVEYIQQDAKAHNYPCVAISYITSPGNELGYRYFFYLNGMHVNQPKSGSPVYTIVFPHSKVDRIDKSFGALGLVLPDYQAYNNEAVNYSCSGANANLTDPLFGYTE